MSENVFNELKLYVGFQAADEEVLRALHPLASPEFPRISDAFYASVLQHEGARRTLEGGDAQVERLKITLTVWLDELLRGPWDNAYFERRSRIGRIHARIALPQHYIFGAMNVVRAGLARIIEDQYKTHHTTRQKTLDAVGKILDLELAVMVHTYRDDLLAQQARHFQEKLAGLGTLTAGLSHEIRNPLNAAKLQLEVLERRLRRLTPSEQPALLEPATLVQEEIARLDHLLEDFLQFARPRHFVPHPVKVASLVPRVLDLLEEDAQRRGVEIERHIETDAAVAGDQDRLRQVLMNLMLNALEAVETGGWVRLLATATPGEVLIAIEDSGPGISPEVRERLFEPFFTTKASGSGLGLPIVHSIVLQHNGSIAVEHAKGGGARFVLRLPRANDPSVGST